jgi:predicted nucleic acid-binding protein
VIVVDTSVWVSVLRSREGPESAVFHRLLDSDEVLLPVPVRIELLAGARKADRLPLRRALSALPVQYPSDETWQLVDQWVEKAGQAGERFGMGDLLIGALAAEVGALVWSLDSDFERLSRLKLVQIYEP